MKRALAAPGALAQTIQEKAPSAQATRGAYQPKSYVYCISAMLRKLGTFSRGP